MSITTWGWGSQGGLVTTMGWGSFAIDTPELKGTLVSIGEILASLESNQELAATLITAADLIIPELKGQLVSLQDLEGTMIQQDKLKATLEEVVFVAVMSRVAVLNATLANVDVLEAVLEPGGLKATLVPNGLTGTLERTDKLTATLETEECVC